MKMTYKGKCAAFREIFFPPPTTSKSRWSRYKQNNQWDWPELTKVELRNACSAKIKGKTPGPDGITQDMIIRAYETIPNNFLDVFGELLNLGYHPKCWKQAIGAILKKPSQPDYSIPKAYRVIALLNHLGKVKRSKPKGSQATLHCLSY